MQRRAARGIAFINVDDNADFGGSSGFVIELALALLQQRADRLDVVALRRVVQRKAVSRTRL